MQTGVVERTRHRTRGVVPIDTEYAERVRLLVLVVRHQERVHVTTARRVLPTTAIPAHVSIGHYVTSEDNVLVVRHDGLGVVRVIPVVNLGLNVVSQLEVGVPLEGRAGIAPALHHHAGAHIVRHVRTRDNERKRKNEVLVHPVGNNIAADASDVENARNRHL